MQAQNFIAHLHIQVCRSLEQVTLNEILAGQQILVRCAEVSDNHGVTIDVKNRSKCSATACAEKDIRS